MSRENSAIGVKNSAIGDKNLAIGDENSAIDVENDGINYISIDDNEAYNPTVYLIATRCGHGNQRNNYCLSEVHKERYTLKCYALSATGRNPCRFHIERFVFLHYLIDIL